MTTNADIYNLINRDVIFCEGSESVFTEYYTDSTGARVNGLPVDSTVVLHRFNRS